MFIFRKYSGVGREKKAAAFLQMWRGSIFNLSLVQGFDILKLSHEFEMCNCCFIVDLYYDFQNRTT